MVFDVDAKVDGGKRAGNYSVVEINSDSERKRGFGRKGTIKGDSKPFTPRDLPVPCTLRCQMQGALIGGSPDTIGRCMVIDPPKVDVSGDTAVVGKQKVNLKDGNLVLATKGR